MISPSPYGEEVPRAAIAVSAFGLSLSAQQWQPVHGSSLGVPHAGNSDRVMAVDSDAAGY